MPAPSSFTDLVLDDIVADTVTANIFTGTIATAAQPSITSLGTLGSLDVTGTASADTVSATTLTGTLSTAAQPNVTSVGTLSTLGVSGNASVANLNSTQVVNTGTAYRPEPIPSPCAYEGSCIALDPGVRTFLTGYDPSGNILEIAKYDVDKVFQMCYRIDRIMAKVTKAKNHRQRYNRRRAACRARTKLQNCITDLHAKAAKYLCESYELILLPKFTTHQMVRRATRKIRSKTARMMLTFSHYKFRQRLLDKAVNYENTKVMIVNEAYTSKTCTCCGTINGKLGGNKKFNCPSCLWKGDRDINGARNIYLRSVVEADLDVTMHPSLPSGPTPPAIYSSRARVAVAVKLVQS